MTSRSSTKPASKRWFPRLIAIDLDGTLLRGGGDDERPKSISERNKRAVAAARARGAQVVIVTFRAYQSSKKYAFDLGLRTPIMVCNGALVKDPTDDRVIEQFPLPPNVARRAVDYARSAGIDACLFAGEQYVGSAAVIARYGAGYEYQWLRLDDLSSWLDRSESVPPILLVRYFASQDFKQAKRDLAHLDAEFVDDRLEIGAFELSIMQRGLSKRSSLERFARDLDIAREDVMAIGDGHLDAGMIAWAGHGVAMANAAPETLAVADEITASNEDDGVALAIERLM